MAFDYSIRRELQKLGMSEPAIRKIEQLSDFADTVNRVATSETDIAALQDGKQPHDATLDALAGLTSTAGLVEQTGTDAFTKRALGVAAATSVPTRGDADTRYVKQDVGSAWTAATGTASREAVASYAGQTVSDPPTQAEVQAIDDAVNALSQAVVAMITDLTGNGALT